MMIEIHIPQKYWNAICIVDDHIDFAVIEEITECGSAANADFRQSRALNGWYQFERPIPEIVKKQRTLSVRTTPFRMAVRNWINMAVFNEQVFPAVVVVVNKTISETDKGNRRLSHF